MGDFFDKFSKVPLSQKILLLLLVLAAVFLGFYMFLYSGLEEQIDGLQQQEASLRQNVARLQGLLDDKTRLEGEVVQARSAEGTTVVNLPERDDIAMLYKQLEDIAEEVQDSRFGPLEIRTVTREPYRPGPDYTRIPIAMGMSGTYDQALEYCWRLATLDRIIHVRAISLTGGGRGGPGAPVLGISLSIEAFFRPRG